MKAVDQGSQSILGPAVAKEHFGGAAAWGLIAAVQATGLVVGGIAMLRLRPRRLHLVATLGFLLTSPLLFGLGVPPPLLAFVAGVGTGTFGVLWDTSMQQEIPQDRLSRVGSFALIPLGPSIAGPVADAISTRATLFAAGTISLSATLARAARARRPHAAAARARRAAREPALGAAT